MMEEVEFSTISKVKPNPAVVIRNAYKKYAPNTVVFNGLNLTVPEGKIYGLLGPSGCGKTTLLGCIVGRSFLDAGSIQLNVKRRRDIGYMPQFTCLYGRLTIEENFRVYGYIFGLSNEQVLARAKEFQVLLDLPPATSFVENLSGGQQRRVSLAVTLIHDPQLYILDEPTVGLDPVLSQGIWQYLLQQASNGKTVIITTHYIQEARQSHTIGIMRNGKLLAEEPPTNLINKCSCNDLEEVFLELSKRQDAHEETKADYPEKSERVSVMFSEDTTKFSKVRFNSIMYKNLMLMKREVVFILLLCLLPLSQTFFGNYTIGVKPKHLRLGILNHETSLDRCTDMMLKDCFLNSSHNVYLSCLFLDYLKKEEYIMVENYTITDGKTLAHDAIRAVLQFPPNYTESMIGRYLGGFTSTEANVTGSFIDIWVDNSNQYIATCIKFDVARFTVTFIKQALRNCGLHPESGFTIPLHMEDPIYGSFGESYATYVAAIMLCLCCFFLPTMFTGGVIFVERLSGALERLIICGASPGENIISLMLIQIFVHLVQTIEAMLVTYVWFDNPLEGSLLTMMWLMIAVGVSGMCFGLMLGTSNENMTMTVYAGIGANIAMAFTIGMTWPLEGAHYLLRSIAIYLPNTLPVQAAQAIGFKSFSFFQPVVLLGFASSLGWSLIFLAITYLVICKKNNVWTIQKE